MQTPHKLWPSQELRAIRDCLHTILGAKLEENTDATYAGTYDVATLISQIGECEKFFLVKSGNIKDNLEQIEKEIAEQKLVVEQLEAQAKWENHRKLTASQQVEEATRIADSCINESSDRVNLQQSEGPGGAGLNAKIQHIIDESVFDEKFKKDSVSSLALPLAQLDSGLEE